MNNRGGVASEVLTDENLGEPLTYPVDAFISAEYAAAEDELLWSKVWQMAGRVEDVPEVGNFITYNIGDESIVIIRTSPDTLKAFYNVCPHRGRQLVNTPDDVNCVIGKKRTFVCGFHGWTFDREGKNTSILDKEDWKGALTPERVCLSEVKVDTWGGWIYINMNQDSGPLRDFLEPAAGILDYFEFDKMRYKWRQWVIYPCNWKTALEAFMEPYHVAGTHTQLLKYGEYYAYSKAYGLQGVSGFDERDPASQRAGTSITRAGMGDPRVSTYELARENYETVNYAASTETLVNAAKRLVDELPEGTPAAEVINHWMASAQADDAARGVIWPEIPPEVMGDAGLAWSLSPIRRIRRALPSPSVTASGPTVTTPTTIFFESDALERFPEGQEPKTDWVYAEPSAEHWGSCLAQDFGNMEWVQKGMKSRGFRRPLPNPHQEQKITNFHRHLARFMGVGAPRKLDETNRLAGVDF